MAKKKTVKKKTTAAKKGAKKAATNRRSHTSSSRRKSSSGAVAANFHEGSRSEILADYLFSAWGTVNPVRRQDDFGLDLFCTLTERRGQRGVVTDYFMVQVKSTTDPWVFDGQDSVKWLVEYPQPIFLATVDKKAMTVSVYHVLPRFHAATLPPLPKRLELVPTTDDKGGGANWENGERFSLQAPILRVTISDLMNDARMLQLRDVFAEWVRIDRANCDFVRYGLLRSRTTSNYQVNTSPSRGIVETGCTRPSIPDIHRGIRMVAEAAECIGSQLGRNGDRAAALFAAMLVDHLQRKYPEVFADHTRWNMRLPGDINIVVCHALNDALTAPSNQPYLYEGFDAVVRAVCNIPLVAGFLSEPV